MTNTGDEAREVTVRLRDRGYLLTEKTVTVPAGETRDVQCTAGGLEAPAEVSITLNGQKIDRVHVVEET
jgi:hypothetical protein